MTEGFDSREPPAASGDGSPTTEVTANEIARLTLYADAQEEKVRELGVTVANLRHALESRVVIERAIGMLSERFDRTIVEAWELLRAAARDSRREVRALANEVTESRAKTPHEIVETARRLLPH
jgi:ANTAR domain